MIKFLLLALVLNVGMLTGLFVGRHRVARMPMPGLWWLCGLSLAVVLTLQLARVSLP